MIRFVYKKKCVIFGHVLCTVTPSHSGSFIFPFFTPDPRFINVHLIPESDNPEDDKLFLFFKENAMDGENTGKATIARIGQLCKVTTHTHTTKSLQ